MDFKESRFEVVNNNNCPVYQAGDEFKILGRTLSLMGKPACLTLMSDVTTALSASPQKREQTTFTCSGSRTGCAGTIRLRCLTGKEPGTGEKIKAPLLDNVQELNNFSIFKTLKDNEVAEIVTYFKIQEFKTGQIILRKGDRGEKLFIVLSGSVEIIGDYGTPIAVLGKGEIFGEMSLLTGNPVSTKVRVLEDTKTMVISASHFRMILNRYSPLQMYFARLLVQRLAKSNIERSKQVSSGMAGNLSEITTTELLQALNMSQKTGALTLSFPKGEARISLREGDIIHAEFRDRIGEEAFFEIIKEKRGKFQFKPILTTQEITAPKIGEFMYLMMEAMNRIDDAASPEE
ncbi:MAG: cyclic nucleotide-binding domain-containing protein [Desulfosalsimonadaceae bacterium]